MTKILFITVGGSHQPVVTSIKTQKPDRIIFICSDGAKGSKSQVIGEGKPCEVRKGTEVIESLPNIPTQLGLGDSFQVDRDLVLIQEPDSLSECYNKISQKIAEIKDIDPTCQITADYTGGTKTMSCGLAIASLDAEVPLFLTTNTSRQNLIKVESGERTKRAATTGLTVTRTIEKTLPIYLEKYNYGAAIADLNSLIQGTELIPEATKRVEGLLDRCEGFEAWDRFDHQEAISRLAPYISQSSIKPYGLFLKKVIASRGQLDRNFDTSNGMNGNGYEVVEDLLLNADRRANQQRYDDAVGRLYRALELLAQIRLFKTYEIQTGDVDITKLPESLQPEYEGKRNHKIQIGLTESYELLSKISDDALGQLYLKQKNSINNALQVRNYSLFAHGFQSIDESRYQTFNTVVANFITDGIAAVTAKSISNALQFPKSL